VDIERRTFLKATALGGAVGLGLFDLSEARAELRTAKILRTTETRSICPYCAVACGVIIHTIGDKAKNVTPAVSHVEGDPDHPTNRGTLCPKGAALLDFVKSETRTKFPRVREAGSKEWKQISWDDALNRIVRHMKADRDANFVATNRDGATVNRWTTTGFLAASATTNETAFVTYKAVRSAGMLVFDNQARV